MQAITKIIPRLTTFTGSLVLCAALAAPAAAFEADEARQISRPWAASSRGSRG